MSYFKPIFRNQYLELNKLGYRRADYEGVISTLCAGCGHDSICAAIIQACYESDIAPHHVAKMSGIGCSSKAPAYYLNHSHGFNSVHGRMPSVTTGAALANKDLIFLGVSGDGDTASIGMGQFVHAARRNINMTYIVMNNGCYGLTKGQDSATADKGSAGKSKKENPFQAIDLASLAVECGASFVGRSFSGDKKQLVPMIRAAMAHKGFAFIDVVSPCVTFNNTATSTKSYDYVRAHQSCTSEFDFVPKKEEINIVQEAGHTMEVELHDGSKVELLHIDKDWDPMDKFSAIAKMNAAKQEGQILTGLIYLNPNTEDLHTILQTVDQPLNQLNELTLCPGSDALSTLMDEYA